MALYGHSDSRVVPAQETITQQTKDEHHHDAQASHRTLGGYWTGQTVSRNRWAPVYEIRSRGKMRSARFGTEDSEGQMRSRDENQSLIAAHALKG